VNHASMSTSANRVGAVRLDWEMTVACG
jgi:hypothetical protein